MAQRAVRRRSVVALSAALAVAIALPLAWFLWRRHAPWANIFQLLGIAPFMLPPVITALGFLTFWATIGFYGQPWTAVVSHAIFFVTLPLVTLSLGFASIDRSLVEAAATMGADDRTVFRTVVLPLIRPYLVSGYAFAFVLSLNEYIVAYMTVGFTVETLPIKIFNALRYGYTPTMASVTMLFVAIAAMIFGLVARFGDLPRLLGAMSSDGQMMRIAALQMQAVAGDVAANLARIARGCAGRQRQRRRPAHRRRNWRSPATAPARLRRARRTARRRSDRAGLQPSQAKPASPSSPVLPNATATRIYNSAVFTDGRHAPVVYRKSHLYGDYERAIFAASDPSAAIVGDGVASSSAC